MTFQLRSWILRQKTIGLIAMLCGVTLAVGGCTTDNIVETKTNAFPSSTLQPGTVEDNVRFVRALSPPTGSQNATELLAAHDKIEIDVFRVDELDRKVEISADGTINLPLIGTITAAGFSPRQLEQKIASRYRANYLQNPQVGIVVKSAAARRVNVDGEIERAGVYPITVQSSLSRVLSQAGGLRRVGDPEKIYIFRTIGKERHVARYSLNRIRTGIASDPRVFGGDVIVVFPSSGQIAMRNLREAFGAVRSATSIIPLL